MKNKRILQIALFLILLVGTVYVAVSQKNAPYRHMSGKVFGTYYNITYQSTDDLQDDILKALGRVDSSLSMFNPNSTVSRVNRGENINIDDMLLFLFPKAMEVSKATNGAFDITVAPLVNAWGFGFKEDKWPTDTEIDSLRAIVGYTKVHLNDRKIVKDNPKTMIDLSAIAKGYGSDVVAEVLEKSKVENFMVEIGGEVVVKGKNDKGEEWKIGVAKPNDSQEAEQEGYQCILQFTNRATATSGNYRNFYYKDGVKYAHTIDPRTGRPVQQDVISATIIAPHCYEADAFATSCMVMGLEKSKDVLAKQKDILAYLIYIKDGKQQIWMSSGMKQFIVE